MVNSLKKKKNPMPTYFDSISANLGFHTNAVRVEKLMMVYFEGMWILLNATVPKYNERNGNLS